MLPIAVLSSSNTIRKMIKGMLFGFADAICFSSVEELLSYNKKQKIDFLILDRTVGEYEAKDIIKKMKKPLTTLLLVSGKYEATTDKEDYSFILHKPFKEEELREIIAFLNSSLHTNKEKEKIILVVDDSKISRDIMKSSLSLANYKVIEANNGKEALEIINTMDKPPALIVTDQEMPEMNGIELAKNIRNSNKFSRIPIIMATSLFDDINLKKECFESGINKLISKPFSEAIIQNTVKAILESDLPEHHDTKIILFDNYNTTRQSMVSTLNNAGFNIITTDNAKQFFQLTKDNRFNLCLINYTLNDTTGIEAAQHIKKYNNDCPIIIYTAFDNLDSKKDLPKIYKAGINDYLLSPFEIEELVFKIKIWLDYYKTVKDLKEKEQLIRINTTYDALTGVLNRFNTLKRGEEYFSLSKRKNQPISILYLDIDHFKNVNDTYGHNVGDIVLRKFASVISSNIREEDIFGRIGGEEFLVILPFTDKAKAILTSNKLLKAVSDIRFDEIKDLHITTSIGLAYYDKNKDIKIFDQLLALADKMLYKAKESGRNRVVSL